MVGLRSSLDQVSPYYSSRTAVCPDIPTVAFFFLKTDLIRAFYTGALPSFAECKQLRMFKCYKNQFSGAYSRVSTDRSVVFRWVFSTGRVFNG